MAAGDVTVSFVIPAAEVARVEANLCTFGGVPNTPANARAVVVSWVIATVEAVDQAAYVPLATGIS